MHSEYLGCPNCGSQSTQSMPMAYSQAYRLGEGGHRSISEFGQAAAPPPVKKLLVGLFRGRDWRRGSHVPVYA